MKKLFCLILTLSVFLSGCGYGRDVDEQSFVIAVGIDKGESFPLRISFVFANPSGSSKDENSEESSNGEESKNSSDSSSDIVTVEASTIFSATRKLDAIKSKKINLTHTKLVVFSDELAKSGIKKYVEGFASSHDFRPNTYVCISSGSAQKYLDSVKPSQEKYIEKYYDHIMKKVASDKVNEAYLYYLYFNLHDKYSSSIVPLVGVNENDLKAESDAIFSEGDDFLYEARAGEVVRKASNKAEILGSAVFRNDKLVTTLGSFRTDISHLICNEFSPANYSILYNDERDFITIRIIQQSNAKIKSKIKNNKAYIDIYVPISIEYVDAVQLESKPHESKRFCRYLSKRLNSVAKKLIYESQKGYDCDFLGLGDSLKKHFSDLTEWEKFNWEKNFSRAEINVSFDILYADFEETN